MRAHGHAGLNMLLAAPVVALYPGSIHDPELWIWLIFFIGMATWPDVDLRLEIKHRSYTHTILGSLIFGILAASITASCVPECMLQGFLGGFAGSLGHIVGDALTCMKFKPFWPLNSREVGFCFFKSSDKRVNSFLAKAGSITLSLALVANVLLKVRVIAG
ncbi:MAG: hypothetical protein DRK00_09305 [Thermoprotei archaeon]|nr:MAG: hypothetical protein DRK00_09305 [Thermoprotei archaeon]